MSVSPFSRRSFLAASTSVTAVAAGAAVGLSPTAVAAGPSPLADPFTLGVASGDPSPDGFVLWTRLAPRPLTADGSGGMPARAYEVSWQVATDQRMQNVIRSGTASARPEWAHSVHVTVRGLRSGAEYFYRFSVGRHVSRVGRTLTTPALDTFGPDLTMAFASCSNYPAGFFTAYRRMAEEQPSLVLHLGDYIYEGPGAKGPRSHSPAKTSLTLGDYRLRHAQYRTDADLQAAHAIAPWLVVWDDHELANNYAGDDSAASLLSVRNRRAAAYKAYYENMPLRLRSLPQGVDMRVFRRMRWGRLATFHMLDTRQYRDAKDGREASDPLRSITGTGQQAWLLDGLEWSKGTWDILGQQVFFAARDFNEGPGAAYNMNSWDGYVASRNRILDGMRDRGVANPVVLTGDVHKHYASNITRDFDDPYSPAVATELVTTSVSSGGDGVDAGKKAELLLRENPHIKFINSQRGYVSTRIGRDQMRADFKVLPYVTAPGAPVSTRASFVMEAGRPGLHRV